MAIVKLEGAYPCYYFARSTGKEATWTCSFRDSCGGAARLIDWDLFRTKRQESGTSQRITVISTWPATLLQPVMDVEVKESVPSGDRYYAKLWARKRKLETLLQTGKWHKGIRRRLARVHTNTDSHAIELTRQTLNDIYSQMDKDPYSKNTLQVLRHLLDPDSGKTAS
ncbi:hypothetical protein MRX96_009405 [Rhipicephalus microplus]